MKTKHAFVDQIFISGRIFQYWSQLHNLPLCVATGEAMKIFKFIIVSILMCGFFFGGFYVGTRSTLDEEITNKISEPLRAYHMLSLDGVNLKASSDELELLFMIKNGVSVDMFIKAQREIVSNNIKKLEDALNEYPDNSDNEIFTNEINRAKKMLSN